MDSNRLAYLVQFKGNQFRRAMTRCPYRDKMLASYWPGNFQRARLTSCFFTAKLQAEKVSKVICAECGDDRLR
jgi:hypothetical protein